MKIGIISDTHDHLGNLEKALQILKQDGVTMLLHCGDVCGPGILQALAGFDVRVARGNMDRHPALIQVAEDVLGRGRLARLHRFTLNGYAAVMIHGDDEEQLGALIASGQYAYIFHGHTHRRSEQRIGRTQVINPGALGGMRYQQRSFCILDLTTDDVRFIRL
jgi:putative phosphoesterase